MNESNSCLPSNHIIIKSETHYFQLWNDHSSLTINVPTFIGLPISQTRTTTATQLKTCLDSDCVAGIATELSVWQTFLQCVAKEELKQLLCESSA
eukprot:scaffold448016_cov33-Prasinocladus_malaysianus.AAC.1